MRLFPLILSLLMSAPAHADLLDYLRRPDSSYSWKLQDQRASAGGVSYRFELVSQTWHGITWRHGLEVHVPTHMVSPRTALLFISGGTGDDLAFANGIGAPVVVLHDVPNQPLLGGKSEDTLIAETFIRYLSTGEDDWPLLLPMTKSVVRAMDAVQAFSRARLPAEIDGFVVTGASKRGWTSWLATAADARIRGVVPRVIDMLNVPAQMPHQLASWGDYSEMLAPYTRPGLPGSVDTDRGRKLLAMVDPYAYRSRLGVPKLIVLGTNDRYWTLDALNLYWDGLPGSKHVLYVPNAGHALDGSWLGSLACFFRSVAQGRPLPAMAWTSTNGNGTNGNGTGELVVRSSVTPSAATVWRAASRTPDFREAHWAAEPVHVNGTVVQGEDPPAREAFQARFATLDYTLDGQRCSFSTQVFIAGPASAPAQ